MVVSSPRAQQSLACYRLSSPPPQLPFGAALSPLNLPLCFFFSFRGSLGSDLAPGQEEVRLSGWSSFTMGLSDLKAEGWVSCA